jgi:hypothetical protein
MPRMKPSTALLLAGAALLAACATPLPAPNTAQADVLKTWGAPTATYTLPTAGQRLEYATGPFGRHTWMIDVDAAGRVTQARQVLGEPELFQFQQLAAQQPLKRDDVLRTIGSPGERRGAHRGGETWSWRYPTNDCLWFQVSLDNAGAVTSTGFGIDPRCDGPSDARQ